MATTSLSQTSVPNALVPARLRWPIRVIWGAFFVFVVALIASHVVPYYHQLVNLEPVGYLSTGWGSDYVWTREALVAAVAELGIAPSLLATYVIGMDFLLLVVFEAVGAFIMWRKSDEWIGVITAMVLTILGFASTSIPIDAASMSPVFYGLIFLLATFVWPTFMMLPALFPDGRFVPRIARFLPVLGYGSFAVMLEFYGDTTPPVSIQLSVMLMFGLSLWAGIYRFRKHSTPAQRQQTKWFLYAVGMWLFTSILTLFIPLFLNLSGASQLTLAIVGKFTDLNFMLIPLGLAFSLLRYRLWDVDFVINRTLVYATLTVILLGLAALSLYGVSQLATNLPGGPLVGVALSAAVFGAGYNPMQKRLRRFVDRRFYHIRLDYDEAPAARRKSAPTGDTQTNLGDFKDMALLGRGGMATVYRADHPTLNTPVAVKVMAAHLAEQDDFRRRFEREAQALSNLSHPNVAALHQFGVADDGAYFMVMEYVDGPDLGAWLKERGALPLDETLPVLRDVASALDYAHGEGLVHRDVKPSNVLLDKTASPPRAVLMDFGIAKMVGADTRLTGTGGMLGTFDYISPEQIQASAEVDGHADVYSLGVMTYQMLTGELPFHHGNPGAILMAHMMQPAPDASAAHPGVPRAAAKAIMQAMAKSPEERFGTAGAFVAALR